MVPQGIAGRFLDPVFSRAHRYDSVVYSRHQAAITLGMRSLVRSRAIQVFRIGDSHQHFNADQLFTCSKVQRNFVRQSHIPALKVRLHGVKCTWHPHLCRIQFSLFASFGGQAQMIKRIIPVSIVCILFSYQPEGLGKNLVGQVHARATKRF